VTEWYPSMMETQQCG